MNTSQDILHYFFHPILRKVSFFVMLLSLIVGWTISLDEESSYTPYVGESITNIILDVSLSMNVQDGDESQNSRLSVSKAKIQDMIARIPGKIGLTIFAGSSQRIVPHTGDRNIFLTLLSSVDRENVSQGGTSVEGAIKDSVNDFLEDTSGSIVLFTDGGEDNWKDIQEIKKIINKKNIEVYIIGVGTKKGGVIPYSRDVFGRVSYKTYNGERVIAKLSDTSLRDLANKLGGKYYHISDISQIDFVGQIGSEKKSFDTFSWSTAFIYIAFICWIYLLAHMYIYKNIFGYKIGKK